MIREFVKGSVRSRDVFQKVLQFQSRGTLAAASAFLGRRSVALPGMAATGVGGVPLCTSEDAVLDVLLLLRLCQLLYCSKQ